MSMDILPEGGSGFDPNDRRLCDDGNCLGVIVSGKCNVCGLVAEADDDGGGSPRDPGTGGTSDSGPPRDPGSGTSDARSPRDPGTGTTTGRSAPTPVASASDAFDESRTLCPDGACVGVVGPDGKCKVCGRSAAS
jgi:hypothetical protein